MFFHIIWNILKKKSECSLFQKISPKSKSPFFVKIFARISRISRKLLNIFFSLFLVPLVEVLRHVLEYSKKNKSEIFPIKKFRNFWFSGKKSCEKTSFSGISRKLLNIFSWLFLVPLEDFLGHLLEHSKKINRNFFQ